MNISRRDFIKKCIAIVAAAAIPGTAMAAPFGQKTLDSNIDRVNIRRLILYIQERMQECLWEHVFDHNHEVQATMSGHIRDLIDNGAPIDKCKVTCMTAGSADWAVLEVEIRHTRTGKRHTMEATCEARRIKWKIKHENKIRGMNYRTSYEWAD